ncbi:MAG: hypothetical protein HXX16_09070 [Bacteroidales bacterium]|nr:hypothetical protein [Bacteroidales bacterium]
MKSIQISKNRIKEFLAEKLAKNVLQSEINDLILVLRFNALGGFEFLSDEDLLENLIAAFPELELVHLVKSDDNYLYLGVKPQHNEEEDNILIDIKKITQLIV